MNIFIVVWLLAPVILVIAVILIELWARRLLKRLDRIVDRMEGDIIGLREGMKHNYDKINALERSEEE